MQLTGNITAENLMSLEAYSKYRKEHKAEVLAHRKLRTVTLGEHFVFQFENLLFLHGNKSANIHRRYLDIIK